MIVPPLVLWNLADSQTTIEELRRYLVDESVDEFEQVEGLRLKLAVGRGDRSVGRGLCLGSAEAARQDLPGRARELIGKEPDITEEFDVEATIEGRFDMDELSDSASHSKLEDEGLREDLVSREALQPVRRQVEGRFAVEELLRRLADRRGLHEAVAREPARGIHAVPPSR